jgi:hypothetical protein
MLVSEKCIFLCVMGNNMLVQKPEFLSIIVKIICISMKI